MTNPPYRLLLLCAILLSGLLNAQNTFDANPARQDTLRQLLGPFPQRVPLDLDTIETVRLDGGTRLKIAYTAEPPNSVFDAPIDRISAYLFVPDRKNEDLLPAIVAIHQDGPQDHIGKAEPVGLAGADDMHYALELFQRGYVVVCPDRFYHAERRRIPGADTAQTNWQRDDIMLSHWTGQLLLQGRNPTGKEAYDLTRAVDVLGNLNMVDTTRIGAIGHSAGGYNLVYFMFVDPRVKVGVSSCGFFEVLNHYGELVAKKRGADAAIPGLAAVGSSADYLAFLAPRPVLLTRGMWEWGRRDKWREYSKLHVQETRDMVAYVKAAYEQQAVPDHLQAIIFEEGNGQHAFPPGVKEQAYQWLDKYLKQSK